MLQKLKLLAQNKTAGFTVIEVVAVVFIMGIIASIVAVAVSAGTKMTIIMDRSAVSGQTASRALQNLSANIYLASPIEQMGQNKLVLQVQRKTVCERHTYVVNTDAQKIPRNLQHVVQALTLPVGTSCKDVALTRWSGVTPSIDRIEVKNLTAGASVFQYAYPGGARLRIPGDNGYDSAVDRGTPCDVGIVEATLTMDVGAERPPQIVKSVTAPASAGWGRTC